MSNSVNIGFLAGAFALVMGGQALYQHTTVEEDVNFTVTAKESIEKNSNSKYLVTTKNSEGEIEVFENTDAWLSGKFAASDVQGLFEEGCEYKADVYGWRVPALSMYRNIVSVESLGGEGCPAPQVQ